MTSAQRTRAGYAGPNPPRYRNDGPETSREAAESLSEEALGRMCRTVYDAIAEIGDDGAILDEISDYIGRSHRVHTVAARLSDLKKMGLIEPTGKRPGESGRNQQVWNLTERRPE